jgi:iron complex outermembrane receptor protein
MQSATFRSIALGMLLGAAAIPQAAAQVTSEPPPPPTDTARTRLDAVVVRGATAPATVGGASAVVVAVDSLRIAPSALFDQAVARLPFIHVRENSRGEAEISMRGSESRQVAVYVDGIPITLAWDHRADISVVPLTGVERLVLVRGVSSLLYGPNALGGIVDVGLADAGMVASSRGSMQIRSSVDEFGGYGLTLAGGAPVRVGGGELMIRGGAGYRARDGFAGARDIADPGSIDGASWFGDRALRTNSDLTHYDGFATLRYRRPGGAWLGLTTTAFKAERGVTPELHADNPRFWRYPSVTRAIAVLSGGTGALMTPFGAGTVRTSFGYDHGTFDIDQYDSNEYATITGSEDGDDRTLTGRILATHSLATRGELRVGLTGASVNHDELLNGTDGATYRQQLWSLGTEADIGVGSTGQISGGIAYDAAATPETGGRPPFRDLSQWGARLGGSVTTMGDALRLHLAASRRARFPSLRELYSSALNQFEPNPELKPETLHAMEAGVTARIGQFDLQGVVFHHRLDDAVVRVRLASPTRFKRINRDELRTTGVELLAGWVGNGVSIDADLTLQDIRVFDQTANLAERRAEHQPEAEGGLRASVPLPLEMRGLAFGRYTGRQYCLNPNVAGQVDSIDGTARGDIGIERAWSVAREAGRALFRSVRVSAMVDNVADTLIYSQCGLPEPGRTLRIGVEIS